MRSVKIIFFIYTSFSYQSFTQVKIVIFTNVLVKIAHNNKSHFNKLNTDNTKYVTRTILNIYAVINQKWEGYLNQKKTPPNSVMVF